MSENITFAFLQNVSKTPSRMGELIKTKDFNTEQSAVLGSHEWVIT